ncbi:MAG: cryptochrome/photolyase family protein [Flavobacteriaceae bacterium]|tara:strand:+ start:3710 stop:4999 length:1290 start_codon:yes stop_codon:yes gene_type:complete
MKTFSIFWFRRDIRIEDNNGLSEATKSKYPVIPIFIFDEKITENLPKNDTRINFIHKNLNKLNNLLVEKFNSKLQVFKGNPIEIIDKIVKEYNVKEVYTNHDYEPYAIKRDNFIYNNLKSKKIPFYTFKDQVIFEKNEVLKDNGSPYVVFTPYMRKWKENLKKNYSVLENNELCNNFHNLDKYNLKEISEYGFEKNISEVINFDVSKKIIEEYEKKRNFPSLNSTSKIGPFLRFGVISIRSLVKYVLKFSNETFLNELIWREFFMQILFHFPNSSTSSFKSKYDNIKWVNDKKMFEAWKNGKTGFPIVDAGMNELNKTGFMHNRVRMITSSFLCKQLLIDWRWGEKYFALKLNDYEMSSNVGNWQWASGSGVDAAPYFRIFNPYTQIEKFDKNYDYINNWIDLNNKYPKEIVNHKEARENCLKTYKMYV